MKKTYLVIIVILILSLFGFVPQHAKAATTVNVSDSMVEKVYNQGVKEGKIDKEKVTYSSFLKMCKEEVIPAYKNYHKLDAKMSFSTYLKNDNYEQPYISKGDKPTNVTAVDHSPKTGEAQVASRAKGSYHMKAGDILVIYGSSSAAFFVGHAGIASSSKYVMEMPGKKHYSAKKNAHHTTKKAFFKKYTGKSSFVIVYRIKKHPHYAKNASSYAYRKMYKKYNPTYNILKGMKNLYKKSPSYCSKYVYLAYRWGAKKSSVRKWGKHHLVTPHGLVGNFKGSFKPKYIHKITKY